MAAVTLPEVLDDLCSRFVINIPQEELDDPIRVCFALEQAHWFYLDFYREENDTLPNLNMQAFMGAMFGHWAPFTWMLPNLAKIMGDWRKYKKSVPVCGALILNPNCSKVLLVKSWGKHGIWGFPKGKINKQEANLTCAIREVREETGFDISVYARADCLIQAVYGEQENTLFIVVGVPETEHFEPLARKEISEIKWHKLSALTGKGKLREPKHIMIEPTINDLKKWLKTDLGQRMRSESMTKAEANSIFSSLALKGAALVAHDDTDASMLAALKTGGGTNQQQQPPANQDAARLMQMFSQSGGGGGGQQPPASNSTGQPPEPRKQSLLPTPPIIGGPATPPAMAMAQQQPVDSLLGPAPAKPGLLGNAPGNMPIFPGAGGVAVGPGAPPPGPTVKQPLLPAPTGPGGRPGARVSLLGDPIKKDLAGRRGSLVSPHQLTMQPLAPAPAAVNPVVSPTSPAGLNDLMSFQFDVAAVMAPLNATIAAGR